MTLHSFKLLAPEALDQALINPLEAKLLSSQELEFEDRKKKILKSVTCSQLIS